MLYYEPLQQKHSRELLPIWSDIDVIRYTGIEEPCTLKQIQQRITLLEGQDTFVLRRERDVMGVLGCPCIDKAKKQYGFFYHLRKDSWNQGYGSLAAAWLVQHMQEQYQTAVLLAEVISDNKASERILCKLDFELIGETMLRRGGEQVCVHQYQKVL